MYRYPHLSEDLESAVRTIATCAGGAHDLPIEHLQLNKSSVKEVRAHGLRTIGELAASLAGKGWVRRFLLFDDRYSEENIKKIISLANVCENGRFDWLRYWQSIDHRFSFPAMKLDDLEDLHGLNLEFDICHLNLGKAEFLIRQSGITTCIKLIKALSVDFPHPKGFGKNKLEQLTRGIIEFLRDNLISGKSCYPETPQGSNVGKTSLPMKPLMSEAAASLGLEAIHLGKQIHKLESAGINNVGALLEWLETGLPHIWAIGRKSLEKINEAAGAFERSLDESGNVDWNLFASACNYPVIPDPSVEIRDGHAFLSILPEVTSTLACECFDEVETAALHERLTPHNATTLEALGDQFGVSRERIRQKQMKILNSISSALLDGHYSDMEFRFSDQFSNYWRRAAGYFGGAESLSYHDFVGGLADTWGVDSSELLPHLPLIYCVLTKDGRLPTNYKARAKIPSRVFDIAAADAARPIRSLHPSSTLGRNCESHGIATLRDFIEELWELDGSVSDRILERFHSDILKYLVIDESDRIDWDDYYSKKGIKILPEREVSSVEDFVDCMVDSILEFSSDLNWSMATSVLRLRSIPEAAERKSLRETAEVLGTFGPFVKKTETKVLGMINDAIFHDEYTDRKYRFQPAFVAFFKDAQHIISDANSIEYATSLLREAWILDSTHLEKIVPLLSSIIKRYPQGRSSKRTESRSGREEGALLETQPRASSIGTIKLRGFRSVC
jgi:hypothetical protein